MELLPTTVEVVRAMLDERMRADNKSKAAKQLRRERLAR
jgi:hypothetical protein